MADVIQFPGTLEWTGENPGISLKTDPQGPFTTLASFFRVVFSPHGRGHALVLARAPNEKGAAGNTNVCLTDNEPMARWLVANYVAHFAAFRGLPALDGLAYRRLDSVQSSGDPLSEYAETARAGGDIITLTWSGLGAPFCFANPPDKSATGAHYMPSVFIGCRDAAITVNGQRLPGSPVPREVAGRPISTAMLAFSETWIRAN